MFFFLFMSMVIVAFAMGALLLVAIVLSNADEIEPTYNAPPPGPTDDDIRASLQAILDQPKITLPMGSSQIAQDRITTPRRESGPPAGHDCCDAASEGVGVLILPFGTVDAAPGYEAAPDVDCPCPIEQASPMCDYANPAPPAEADFGGMGGGHAIGDVGGDW